MATLEKIVLKMNELLEDKQLNQLQFNSLVKALKEQFNLNIQILDFEFFNEDRLSLAQNEKMKNLKLEDFEAVYDFRQLELKCQKLIELKSKYKIGKSMFRFEQDCVLYMYLGNARNDKLIKGSINK